VSYVERHKEASCLVTRPSLELRDELDTELYEVMQIDSPIHEGFIKLQYAKLKMDELYYGLIDEYEKSVTAL
jgi:hypothetical protein